MFEEHEKRFEQEALALKVGEIPEADLTLSPLVLVSQFYDERVVASLDPYGSNTNLIDPKTAVNLHNPVDRPSDLVAEQPEADSRKEAPDHDPQIHEKDVVPATVENDVTVHVLSDNSPLSQRDQSIEERDPGHIGANPSGGQTESQFAGERTGETSENVDEGASATTGGTRISPTAEGRQDCESSVRASELSDLNDHSSAPGN